MVEEKEKEEEEEEEEKTRCQDGTRRRAGGKVCCGRAGAIVAGETFVSRFAP